MVFLLAHDVFLHLFDIRLADRKSCVSTLPMKVFILCAFRLHPLRTPLFDFFNDLFEGVILGQRKQSVNVVFSPADYQRGAISPVEYACLIGIQAFLNIIGNPGLAMFRAVDKMDQVLD